MNLGGLIWLDGSSGMLSILQYACGNLGMMLASSFIVDFRINRVNYVCVELTHELKTLSLDLLLVLNCVASSFIRLRKPFLQFSAYVV